MDWLRKNFDKAILIVTALVLLVCCGLIISSAIAFPDQFAEPNSPKPPDNAIKPLPMEALTVAPQKVIAPELAWA